MKPKTINIFDNKYFKWTILIVSLLTTIHTIYETISQERTIADLFSITFLIISILTIITILSNNKYAEKVSLYFIVIDLILVNVAIEFANFLYSVQSSGNIINFFGFENMITIIYIIVGLVLLVWLNQLLAKNKKDKSKLYSDLYILIGIFSLLRLPILSQMFNEFDITTGFVGNSFTSFPHLLIKSILALLIISFGYLLRKGKIKLKIASIFVILVLIIYGIV